MLEDAISIAPLGAATPTAESAEGKFKKKQLNARRNSRGLPAAGPDQIIIVHLGVVTSLIEGRPVSPVEIVAMVRRILRQHSMDNQENLI